MTVLPPEILLAVLAVLPPFYPVMAVVVEGRVYSSSPDHGVLPGVTVEVFDERASRTLVPVITQPDGYYQLRLLPGMYTLVYTMEGFRPERRQHVGVNVGPIRQDVYLTFRATESLTVTESESLVDPQRPTTATASPPAAIEVFGGRNTLVDALRWLADLGIVGSPPLLRLPEVTVDNATVRGVVAEGAVLDGGIPVLVLRGGLPAEYGGGQNGTVLALTARRPGNGITAFVDGRVQPSLFRATERDSASPFPRVTRLAEQRVQASVGGPIRSGTLWIFGAYETDKQRNSTESARHDTRGMSEGAFRLVNVRLTATPTAPLTISSQYVVGSRTASGVIGDYLRHFESTVDVASNDLQERRWSEIFAITYGNPQFYVESTTHISNDEKSFKPRVLGASLAQKRDVLNGFRASDGPGFILNGAAAHAVGVTIKTDTLIGRHNVGLGGTIERSRISAHTQVSGGFVVDNDHMLGNVTRYLTNGENPQAGRDDRIVKVEADLYLQDNIRVLPRFTMNAGVRWERVRVTREPLALATNIPLPRGGVVFDVFGNGRASIKGSYGAYAEQPTDDEILGFLSGNGIGTSRFDTPLSVRRTMFGPATVVEPNLHARSSVERSLAYEQRLTGKLSGRLSVTRHRLNDDIALTACSVSIACIGNPGRGILSELPRSGDGRVDAVPRPSRKDERLQLELLYVGEGGSRLAAGYTFGRAVGNVDVRAFPATLFAVDPYIDARRAFADFYRAGANGNSVTTWGPLYSDRRHHVAISGSWQSVVRVNYSAYWQSGAPISRYGYSDLVGSYVYLLRPRGSEGRTPAVFEVNTNLEYIRPVGDLAVGVQVSLFNLLNAQRRLQVDERWAFRENDNAATSPSNPHFGQPILRTPPRTVMLSARIYF